MILFNGKYSAEEQINIYGEMIDYTKQRLASDNIILEDVYSEDYNFETADKFRNAYVNIVSLSKALSSGVRGEELAFRSLTFLDCNARILRSVQTPSYKPQLSVEHDIIMITDKAIFTVEVKNLSAPKVIITEQGVMIQENSRGEVKVCKNVVQQSRWHQTSIRKLLQGTRFEKVGVVPVLMFTNDMCSFENRFSDDNSSADFCCCYRATAGKVIRNCGYSQCLTLEDMAEIEEIIKSASDSYSPRGYDLCVGVEEYTELLENFIEEVKEERKRQEKLTSCSVDEIRKYLSSLLISHNKN